MQMTEKERMLLGMLMTILMTRKGPSTIWLYRREGHAEAISSMNDALVVLNLITNPESIKAGTFRGDNVIRLFNDLFPDPEELHTIMLANMAWPKTIDEIERGLLRIARSDDERHPKTIDEIERALLREP